MNERYIKWYTPYLSREFEMLAFGNGGELPLILFPTSFGRYHQNKDFGLVGSVSDAIALESQLKKWSRAKKVELINRMNPSWLDLGADVLQDR